MEVLLAFAIALCGSIIPTMIYVSIAWWLDRYEKEPIWLMALAFIWGCVPAILFSCVAELGILIPLMELTEGADEMFVSAVLVAPPVEEFIKGIPLLVIFLAYRKEFDGLMDGLLYGALVGFGFAMTENFIYIIGAYGEGGLGPMFATLVLRTIVFGMMHALWTSMFGLGLGIARYAKSPGWLVLPPLLGLASGMLFHMIHNFGSVMGGWFILLSLISYVSGCTLWLILVFIAGRSESRWIQAELSEEVRYGLISYEQAIASYTYRTRVKTRWYAWRQHGAGHAWTLGTLYSKSAKLAIKKRQLSIHPNVRIYALEVGRLREQIVHLQVKLSHKQVLQPQGYAKPPIQALSRKFGSFDHLSGGDQSMPAQPASGAPDGQVPTQQPGAMPRPGPPAQAYPPPAAHPPSTSSHAARPPTPRPTQSPPNAQPPLDPPPPKRFPRRHD